MDNLPPGTSHSDPRAPWNAPDPEECQECGEDVMPGSDCEHCGSYAPDEEDHREAALERKADAMREEGW